MKIERLPLNALRAFSEAARAGSFKTAAKHLGVTPGAVSRQVKQLEDRLGAALFERHANGMRVSEAGHLLAEDVDAGLARIASGVLVCPFGERHVIDSPFTYDLILPATGQAPPAIQHFIDWLIAEAERFRQLSIA